MRWLAVQYGDGNKPVSPVSIGETQEDALRILTDKGYRGAVLTGSTEFDSMPTYEKEMWRWYAYTRGVLTIEAGKIVPHMEYRIGGDYETID